MRVQQNCIWASGIGKRLLFEWRFVFAAREEHTFGCPTVKANRYDERSKHKHLRFYLQKSQLALSTEHSVYMSKAKRTTYSQSHAFFALPRCLASRCARQTRDRALSLESGSSCSQPSNLREARESVKRSRSRSKCITTSSLQRSSIFRDLSAHRSANVQLHQAC